MGATSPVQASLIIEPWAVDMRPVAHEKDMPGLGEEEEKKAKQVLQKVDESADRERRVRLAVHWHEEPRPPTTIFFQAITPAFIDLSPTTS